MGHAIAVRTDYTAGEVRRFAQDRKSTRLNSSHSQISYAVFCLKKKKNSYTSHLSERSKIFRRRQVQHGPCGCRLHHMDPDVLILSRVSPPDINVLLSAMFRSGT